MGPMDLGQILGSDVVQARQPIGFAGIEWSNPITQGLVFADTPTDGLFDQVTGLPGTITGSHVSIAPGQMGLGYIFDGSQANDALSWGLNFTGVNNATQLTIASLALPVTPGGTQNYALADCSGYASGCKMWIGWYGGVWSPGIQVGGAGTNYDIGIAPSTYCAQGTPNVPHLWAGSWIAPGGAAQYWQFYIDGTSCTSQQYGGYPNNYIGSIINPLQVGQDGSGEPFVGQIYLTLIWNRALTAAEHASLAANPWQVFRGPILGWLISSGLGADILLGQCCL